MTMKKVSKIQGLNFFLIGFQPKRKIKNIKIVGAVLDLPAKPAHLHYIWAKMAVLIKWQT